MKKCRRDKEAWKVRKRHEKRSKGKKRVTKVKGKETELRN